MSDTTHTEPEVQEELLSSHNYDGIQEYDNPTPGWWNWLFIGSIVFTPIYVLWFHSPVAPRTLEKQYEDAYAANMKLQFGEIGTLEPTRANIVKYMHDEKWLGVGAATFATNCKSCHGAEGEGISAPNMTDDYYKNIKNIEDIAKVVHDGANNGAMPAWGNRLHPNEIVLVASYVASLRGENKPGRDPEGTKLEEPWPTSVEDVEANSESGEAAEGDSDAAETDKTEPETTNSEGGEPEAAAE